MAEALFALLRGARDVIQVVIDHNVGAMSLLMVICYTAAGLVEIGHIAVDLRRETLLLGTAFETISGQYF